MSSTLTLPASAETRTLVRDELPAVLTSDSDWVSASATRNFCLQDPLLDWLDRFGSLHGFVRDDELPGYDPRTDFTRFIFERAQAFEERVVEELDERIGVVRIASSAADARSRELPGRDARRDDGGARGHRPGRALGCRHAHVRRG